MLRKTLTILSVIGLLLTLAAWGVSYTNVVYQDGNQIMISLTSGAVALCQWDSPCPGVMLLQDGADHFRIELSEKGWTRLGFQNLSTQWRPSRHRGNAAWAWLEPFDYTAFVLPSFSRPLKGLVIPLWIPVVVCMVLPGYAIAAGVRRRQRAAGGQCVSCGYCLHGLTEPRCPECGTPFGEKLLKKKHLMLFRMLKILSLVGLLLSVGLWGVSCSEGWSHTRFYIGQSGEEIGITFICADGRIGWDEAGDMSDSVLSPDHGVPLWLSTVVLAGSFLFCVFHKFCQRVVRSIMRGAMRTAGGIGMVLGRTTDKLRKPLTAFSLTGLLLSVGLWGASYWNFLLVPTASGPMIYLTQGSLQTHWSNVPSTTIPSGGSMPVGQIIISDSSFTTSGGQVTSFTASGMTFGTGWACNGFRGLTTQWKASVDRTGMPVTWSVILPLWIPSAVFAAASPSIFLVGRRYRRRRLGLCMKCGYNLRGLTEPRCPECNTSFDDRLLEKDA